MKRTKIVATIGPASENEKILRRMIEEGMNVARLNFSHGDFAWHKKIIRRIRGLSEKMKVPVGIMADLQGPRIRTIVKNDLFLKNGERVIFYDLASKISPKMLNYKIIGLDYPGIIKKMKTGNRILIADGMISVNVRNKKNSYLEAEVSSGGMVKNHKGVNIPDANLKFIAFTKKDKEDLKFALSQDIDYVALSFVSNASDIKNLKKRILKIIRRKNSLPQIIAKIEKKDAVENFSGILKETDAVMVARGDLGIEMEESKVAVIQKEIVDKSLRAGKPVIVATQMLGSMVSNSRPTRAEVSDVSNAVVDHADAVMLSEETATGKYPMEAVKTMEQIILRTEASPYDDLVHGFLGDAQSSVSAAIAQSAHELLKDSGAEAIVVASVSGFTARMIARHRPEQKILVMTNNEKTHNQLTLVWGTESFVLPDCKTSDKLIDNAINLIRKNRLVKKGKKVVVVAGRPHAKKEHMSLIKVEEIK